MSSYNRVILMGNLTRDPELKYGPTGTAICSLGLALNRKRKDEGEEVCFVDVTVFGKQAETINSFMSKGRQILIEGRLKFDRWEDSEGKSRSKHSVICEHFSFTSEQDQGGGGSGSNRGGSGSSAPPMPADEDIPF